MMQANEKTGTTLLALAERCEASIDKGLDALDYDIATALDIGRWSAPGNSSWHFTRSIDAALTLIPDGAWWNVEGSAGNGYSACTMTPNECIAHTPALAICAAALRARANTPD